MLPLENGFIMEDDPHFPLGADAVALAHHAGIPHGARVCDLGCGAGGVALLLAANRPDLRITGVELRPAAAALFRENIRRNGAEARMTALEGDLRDIRRFLEPASFGAVTANPPYRAVREGRLPADPDAAAARTECCGSLADFCAAAAYLLPAGGSFHAVYPPERLPRLFAALEAAGLAPKALTLLYPDADHAPSIAVCRAVRGAKPGLLIAPPVFLGGTP